MIRELTRLGEAVLANDEAGVLEALIEDIGNLKPKRGNAPHLVVLNLSSEGRLEWRTEVLDPPRAEAYLWLGNPRANAPKVRVTTSNLAYLLGQTFYALTEDADTPPELRAYLERVFPKLFWHDPEARGGKRKYAYLLDAQKLGLDVDWPALRDLPPKQRPAQLAKALTALFDLPKQGVLYTLAIDGTPLAQLPAYRAYMLRKLVGELFEDAKDGVCHACGARTAVNAKFTHFKIKLFINDKLSFAYGLDAENWTKNHALCQRCYTRALSGERYLERHLSTRVLGTETLIVPHLDPTPLSQETLDALSALLRETTSSLERLESVPELLDRLEPHTRLPQLTLLFIRRAQSAVKLIEAVPEVEPSRIEAVLRAIGEANRHANTLFGAPRTGAWLPGLAALLDVLPLKHEQGAPHAAPALRVLRQILLGEPLSRPRLLREFLQVLRYIHRNNPGIYATRSCRAPGGYCPEIEDAIPRMTAFLHFLEALEMLEVNPMELDTKLPGYTEPIQTLGLDAPRTALFLLGVLLARVASEQYKRGKSKPVLEKVGYQGMPLEKVRRFALELFEKLTEYRRLDASSEVVFATATELLAQPRPWPLSDEENAFYILLGYGFETRRILNAGRKEKEDDHEAA